MIAFVLNQTELTTLCCEVKAIDTLIKLKSEGKIEQLKAIIAFDPVNEEKGRAAEEAGLKVYSYKEVLQVG